MANRAIRWRLGERVVGGLLGGVGVLIVLIERIDQIVMVAGLAINDPGAGHPLADRGLDFIDKSALVDASRILRRTGAGCRVGVATGAYPIGVTVVIFSMDRVESGKVGA